MKNVFETSLIISAIVTITYFLIEGTEVEECFYTVMGEECFYVTPTEYLAMYMLVVTFLVSFISIKYYLKK